MKVGRNDPCPCGSGKKYKKCCLELDQQAVQAGTGGGVGGAVRETARRAEEWEADVFAVPAALESDPDARPAARLVAANGFVLDNEILNRPSPEPEEMARTLARGLASAALRVGSWPPWVVVREAAVAEALARKLAAGLPGVAEPPQVRHDTLDDLDEAATALCEHLSGRPRLFFVASPQTWAGWGLPGERVARLFRAAAAFHRAAPWRRLSDADPLRVAVPGGAEWTVCVLGNAGLEYGLHLYSEADDYYAMQDGAATHELVLDGWVLALSFDDADEVGRPMRREVASNGWEVAAPEAYPRLITLNTPAGGVRLRQAEDLEAVLHAVPAFLTAQPGLDPRLAGTQAWKDPATGVEIELLDLAVFDESAPLPVDAALLPTDLSLRPGGAQGSGAEPEAALADPDRLSEEEWEAGRYQELAVVDRFADYLQESLGLSDATVDKHAGNAGVFVDFLYGCGVPLRAVHEYDLRTFLYDFYPRKVADSMARREAMPVSLTRFFDFLKVTAGLRCPWAYVVLGDRESYRAHVDSAPLGFFWDRDVAEWCAGIADRLAVLALVPEPRLGDDDSWGALMGPEEASLHRELQRRWLLWRDELIRAGVNEWDDLEDRLAARQKAWELAPHSAFAQRTPVEVIREERAVRAAKEARE